MKAPQGEGKHFVIDHAWDRLSWSRFSERGSPQSVPWHCFR